MGIKRIDVAPLFDVLTKEYQKPHRTYHNLHHIQAMLKRLEECNGIVKHPFLLKLAIWFHDAVYDVGAKDNEIKSAELWNEMLPSYLDEDFVKWGEKAILATIDHLPNDDHDIQILLDLDMAELGYDYEVFSANTEKIRQEYSDVSTEEFDKGRNEFFKNILKRDRIFSTDFWHSKLEEQARKNLQRAIA